jgi:hypothetical protein
MRWRALRYEAEPVSEAPFARRRLGFVWNDYGDSTLVVENETQGMTHDLDSPMGERAVSFNDEQDSESRGFRDDEGEQRTLPYPYLNFDLIDAESYLDDETRVDAELRGWSDAFTITAPKTRIAFGAITIAQREALVFVPSEDAADQVPV